MGLCVSNVSTVMLCKHVNKPLQPFTWRMFAQHILIFITSQLIYLQKLTISTHFDECLKLTCLKNFTQLVLPTTLRKTRQSSCVSRKSRTDSGVSFRLEPKSSRRGGGGGGVGEGYVAGTGGTSIPHPYPACAPPRL